jgi:hypothetical protein
MLPLNYLSVSRVLSQARTPEVIRDLRTFTVKRNVVYLFDVNGISKPAVGVAQTG